MLIQPWPPPSLKDHDAVLVWLTTLCVFDASSNSILCCSPCILSKEHPFDFGRGGGRLPHRSTDKYFSSTFFLFQGNSSLFVLPEESKWWFLYHVNTLLFLVIGYSASIVCIYATYQHIDKASALFTCVSY